MPVACGCHNAVASGVRAGPACGMRAILASRWHRRHPEGRGGRGYSGGPPVENGHRPAAQTRPQLRPRARGESPSTNPMAPTRTKPMDSLSSASLHLPGMA